MTPEPSKSAGRTAVVVGASGAVGSALLPLLQAQSDVYDQIILLSRRATGMDQADHVREILIDFQSPTALSEALKNELLPGQGDLFCAIGTTRKKAGSLAAFRAVDLDIPLLLGRWAKGAGIRSLVVVSSIGASTKSSSDYLHCKGEMEDGLKGLGLPSLTLVRPSLLVANRKESRPGETLGHWVLLALQPLLLGPLRKYRPIPVQQVAKAMIHFALEGGGQIVESDRLSVLAE